MTEPAPEEPVVDLLVTPAELEVWVQEPAGSLATDQFTLKVLWATSVLVRDAGNEAWTHDTIPPRAKLIAEIVAKNYWEHPTGELAETTGPLSSRYIESVVHSMELMEEQRETLERIAADEVETPGDLGGLQVLTTTRGPVEMPVRRGRKTVYVLDAHGSLIPYYDPADLPAGTVIG